MNGLSLLSELQYQKQHKIPAGIYKHIQIQFSYDSNKIEGSNLSYEQVKSIYEEGMVSGINLKVDHLIEGRNHFEAFDFVLDNVSEELSHDFLYQLHWMLKRGTSDEYSETRVVGGYKVAENSIGQLINTVSPECVYDEMSHLLETYQKIESPDLEELAGFHVKFERIHPFSDGNGRVGRLILFKECLRNDIPPFIITADLKNFYMQGLRNWNVDKTFLFETFREAQERFLVQCNQSKNNLNFPTNI